MASVADASDLATIIEQQRNAAVPRTQFIPFYSLIAGDDTELFFVSKITEPLAIEWFATSPAGERIHLGRETLPPSRSLSINLRNRMSAASESFRTGSLRFDFIGDGGALQAWAVVRSGRQSFEVPFIPSDKIAVNELFSYWDAAVAAPRPKLRAEYRITNTTTASVPYTLTLSRGSRVARTETGTLPPLETRVHVVSDSETTRRGWLRLTYGGPPGAVIGAGIVAAEERIAYLPLVTRDNTKRGPGFEILRVPEAVGASSRTQLTLFNSSDVSQKVSVEAVAQSSGALIGARQLSLDPWEVVAVDVEKLFGPRLDVPMRLRVRGTSPSLMVDGVIVAASGEVLDISVHATTSAHKSGTYPIPSLDDYSVRTTIVNLGTEESEITAQYFWDGGTYAVPLFRVAPGGTALLDPSEIAANAKPDILRRTLDVNAKHLALKWGVRRGSKELIGRTEARGRNGQDGFGFNCGGCCFSVPRGAVEPAEIDFAAGESPLFEAVVYYDTCSGTLGPYGTGGMSSSVPSPFSWNFTNISATDGAEEDISFGSVENQTSYTCLETSEPIDAAGRAKTCDKTFNFNGYNKNVPCVEQAPLVTTCGQCNLCCESLYNAEMCKGRNPAAMLNELEDCLGRCENEIPNCNH